MGGHIACIEEPKLRRETRTQQSLLADQSVAFAFSSISSSLPRFHSIFFCLLFLEEINYLPDFLPPLQKIEFILQIYKRVRGLPETTLQIRRWIGKGRIINSIVSTASIISNIRVCNRYRYYADGLLKRKKEVENTSTEDQD